MEDNFPFRVRNPPPEFHTVLYEFYSIFKLKMGYWFLLAILLQILHRSIPLGEEFIKSENFVVAPVRRGNEKSPYNLSSRSLSNEILKLSLVAADLGKLRMTLDFVCGVNPTTNSCCSCNSFQFRPPYEDLIELSIVPLYLIKDDREVYNVSVHANWYKDSPLVNYYHRKLNQIDVIVNYLESGIWYLEHIDSELGSPVVVFRRNAYLQKDKFKFTIVSIENATLIPHDAQFADLTLAATFFSSFDESLQTPYKISPGNMQKLCMLGVVIFCIILLLLCIDKSYYNIKRNRVYPFRY